MDTARAKSKRSTATRIILVLAAVLAGSVLVVVAAIRYLGLEGPAPSPACVSRLYSPYNPKNMEQCVVVCMACSAGVRTTCSTACRLRGAQ